eukprot:6457654-Amphidinium_carterae.1
MSKVGNVQFVQDCKEKHLGVSSPHRSPRHLASEVSSAHQDRMRWQACSMTPATSRQWRTQRWVDNVAIISDSRVAILQSYK